MANHATNRRAELRRFERELDSAAIKPGAASSVPNGIKSSTLTFKKPVVILATAFLILASLALVWLLVRTEKAEPSPWLAARAIQVTDFPHEEFFPSLSPDGNTIVYARRDGSDWDIFSQRVGGFNTRNLTENFSGDDTQPAFSPDGQYLAFRSERDGGGVFVMGASGESVRRLSDRGFAYHPAWSPDSQEVIYTEERFRDPRERQIAPHRLWVVNIKTLEKRLITTKDVVQPQWSPGGHRLAYWATDESSQRDIWSADGRRLIAGVISPGSLPIFAVYSIETGQLEKISDAGSPSAAWWQDDRRALFIFDGAIFLTDTVTKNSAPFSQRRPIRSSDSISRATTAGFTTFWNLLKPMSGCSITNDSIRVVFNWV